MTVGSFVCLGIIGLQLAAVVWCALHECFPKRRPPAAHGSTPQVTHARRKYLDRKAEIERDARRRL